MTTTERTSCQPAAAAPKQRRSAESASSAAKHYYFWDGNGTEADKQTKRSEGVKESINGIRNLIGTYKAYLKIVSLLECLEQDILIPQYRILLKFIPDQYYTDILRLPISYSHVHLSNGFAKARSLSETDLNKYEQTDDEPRFVSLENQGDTPQFNSDKSKPINIPGSNNKKKNKNPIRST